MATTGPYYRQQNGDFPIIGFARDTLAITGSTTNEKGYYHNQALDSPYVRTAEQWSTNTPPFQYYQHLFPYLNIDHLDRNTQRGWFRARVVGSGFCEAFVMAILFYGIAVLNAVLWQLNVWPHEWFSPLKALDTLESPFTTFVFVFILILPSVLLVVFEYYQGSVQKFIVCADRIRLSADILPRFVLEKREDMIKQKCDIIWYTLKGPVIRQSSVLESLTEAGHLLKALVYAIKHRFRKDGSTFSLESLPLPEHLQRELSIMANTITRSPNRYLESLVTMYEKRLAVLFDGNPSGAKPFNLSTSNTIHDHVTTINASIADIYFYRTIWAHVERFADLVRVAMCVWLIYLPFRYFEAFGMWALLWFVIPDMIVNAMFVVSAKRLNAFNDSKDSPFVFYDLGAIAHETAEHVDRSFSFATLEKEQLSFQK